MKSAHPLRTHAGQLIPSRTRWMPGRSRGGVAALRRAEPVTFAARARSNRWVRSASSRRSARDRASRTASETPVRLPRSSRVKYSTETPARTATSPRRSPLTRRVPPASRPTCSGVSRSRREVRKSRTSARLSTSSTVRPPQKAVGVPGITPHGTTPHGRVSRDGLQVWSRGVAAFNTRSHGIPVRARQAPSHDKDPSLLMTAATMLRTGRATTTATVVPRRAPGFALAAAMLGFAVVALDAQIVNVALPAIRGDLGGGLPGLQWVVTGYTLTFSALQLFAGSVADRVGARRAYGAGMVLFVAASVLCGLAPTLPVLVAARVVQGAGAALVAPTSLALIRETYTGARARGRAIAYWAMGGSVAAAAGPVLGGALTALDWRLTFFVNLPVGALALAVLARVTPSERGSSRFDWTGQASAVLGLFALTYAVIEGGDLGC